MGDGFLFSPKPKFTHEPFIYMFIGEYRHTFDAKNRISLPAKFRKELGGSVIVTRGLDHCLFVYPKTAWKKQADRFAAYSTGSAAGRGLSRLMLAGASEAEVDSAGRILIPDYLKSFASLGVKSVVAGVSDRVEIWDENAWSKYTKSIERDADQFAEKLGDQGVL
ncbi:MAG: division/cell wall cluster transcriptional repressor MraZ [Patescibacteria group bacterium]